MTSPDASEAGKALGRLGGKKGGKARAKSLSAEQRSEIARKAAESRWGKKDVAPLTPEVIPKQTLPVARYKGVLDLMGLEIPCYVLADGQRVIGRTSFTEMLTGIKGGGGLEKYLGVPQLKSFLDLGDIVRRMVPFGLPEVDGLERHVKGIPADLAIDICRGMVEARDTRLINPKYEPPLTRRQMEIATKAGMFLSACAKVGLDALIDEATGHQFDRARDALQVKLRAYLSEEMRKWEKTFPDELWREFARLTNWKGSVTQRPKYWGNLVTELVYERLDPDVTRWLKENNPKPTHGRNWHQWLTAEFGIRKLVEHIWTLVGLAKASHDLAELKSRVQAIYGDGYFQPMLSLAYDDEKGKSPG